MQNWGLLCWVGIASILRFKILFVVPTTQAMNLFDALKDFDSPGFKFYFNCGVKSGEKKNKWTGIWYIQRMEKEFLFFGSAVNKWC